MLAGNPQDQQAAGRLGNAPDAMGFHLDNGPEELQLPLDNGSEEMQLPLDNGPEEMQLPLDEGMPGFELAAEQPDHTAHDISMLEEKVEVERYILSLLSQSQP